MLPPICGILALAAALALLLASRLSRRIVEPLNPLALDRPLDNGGYDELAPLLRRVDAQQEDIRRQGRELRRRRIELEAVTAGMREGLILLNRRGIVLSANRAAETGLGLSHRQARRPAPPRGHPRPERPGRGHLHNRHVSQGPLNLF